MARDPSVIVMGEDIVGGAGAPTASATPGAACSASPRACMPSTATAARHADVGIGLHRCGHRRCLLRHASGRRTDVHRFHGRVLRPDLQPGRQVPYMFGGKAETPVVIRAMYGAGFRAAAQHSQMLYAALHAHPGPEGGLPEHTLRHQGPADPEHPRQRPGDLPRAQEPLRMEGEVPEASYAIPFGEAQGRARRQGTPPSSPTA
jgi:pyruvate/2-oxoglutarate/acetoin dehydrogenase E1 component